MEPKKTDSKPIDNIISVFKKRMLTWGNPVEYVNNMYGCHPDPKKADYFDKIYKNK
jgi:hypothetical protein